MIVVVDNVAENSQKYLIYFIHNQTWSNQPRFIADDPALSKMRIYDGFKTVDAIMNFANIRVGPFVGQMGDESIFIISSALNGSHYYDWVRLMGCVRADGSFEQKHEIHYFAGPLDRVLWPMDKPVAAAVVYTEYPLADPKSGPKEADVNLFQANANYQFTIPLSLIKEVFS